jgi:hypothetical protein
LRPSSAIRKKLPSVTTCSPRGEAADHLDPSVILLPATSRPDLKSARTDRHEDHSLITEALDGGLWYAQYLLRSTGLEGNIDKHSQPQPLIRIGHFDAGRGQFVIPRRSRGSRYEIRPLHCLPGHAEVEMVTVLPSCRSGKSFS